MPIQTHSVFSAITRCLVLVFAMSVAMTSSPSQVDAQPDKETKAEIKERKQAERRAKRAERRASQAQGDDDDADSEKEPIDAPDSSEEEVESEEVAPPESTADQPWAKGVSPADKAKALVLFEAGNQFFGRSQYPQALVEYRKAIAVWDHPAIHFNMAVCLINLEEPLEAHSHLVSGLDYDGAAINEELYTQGKTYMKLLSGRLAWIHVKVEEEGARVTLDGQELLVGAGETRKLLLPGRHQIVSSKDNMLTETKDIVLEGGKETSLDIKMRPLSDGLVMKRRWASWKPWTVAGTGVGLTAVGGLLYLLADSDFRTFDAQVGSLCPSGCQRDELPSDVISQESRAKVESIAASSLLITGGVVALTGGVLFYLNRERPVSVEGFGRESAGGGSQGLTFVPTIGPDQIGFSGAMRF